MSKELEKLFKDNYDKNLPEIVRIPPLGDSRTEILKPLEQATLDDIALAVEALDRVESNLYALRRLYRAARAKGALGRDNIVEALTRKIGGAQ